MPLADVFVADAKRKSKLINIDDMEEDAEEKVGHSTYKYMPDTILVQEKSSEEHSEEGSQAAESDYDVDEEYDNDYAENYFDNGEGDDMDDLGGGGGGEEGGGMKFYVFSFYSGLMFFLGGDYD